MQLEGNADSSGGTVIQQMERKRRGFFVRHWSFSGEGDSTWGGQLNLIQKVGGADFRGLAELNVDLNLAIEWILHLRKYCLSIFLEFSQDRNLIIPHGSFKRG